MLLCFTKTSVFYYLITINFLIPMKKFLINNFLCLTILLIASTNLYAAGLMITPSRVELKGDVRSQEVKLINKSNETITYKVDLQHLRMNEKGEYQEISAEESNVKEKFADDLLRFSPKKITLKPNEVQTIRLAVNKGDKSPDGEYRSHLLFREEPSADFKQTNNVEADTTTDKKSGKISIVLKPLFGISIPVIVNKGNVVAKSSIGNIAVRSDEKNKSKKYVSVELKRSGEASLYGNVLVTFKPNKTGKEYNVGSLNAVSVFSPYEKRTVMVDLDLPKGVALSNGSLDVKYVSRAENSTENKILSRGSLAIN